MEPISELKLSLLREVDQTSGGRIAHGGQHIKKRDSTCASMIGFCASMMRRRLVQKGDRGEEPDFGRYRPGQSVTVEVTAMLVAPGPGEGGGGKMCACA